MIDTKSISKQILSYNPSHLIIGFSGGVDSRVILDITKQINIPKIAIHINHNINKMADSWQNFCYKTAENLSIEFIEHKLGECPKKESFEAWASKQRMDFFEKIMSNFENPLLILGHHQNDQAETFILQAIRGSGTAGLSGMPFYKRLEKGAIIRPLLNISREKIEKYALSKSLKWVEDDSNLDTKYRRNFIRHEIIPKLKKYYPSVDMTLSRSAKLCAKSNNILNKLLLKELNNIQTKNNNIGVIEFIKLDLDIQENILHLWFKKNTNFSLKNNQINSLIKHINSKSETGFNYRVSSQYSISINYNEIQIIKESKQLSFNKEEDIKQWLLENNLLIPFENLKIRERMPNDRCRYIGRKKKNKLKIILQELKIPSSKRNNIKIITNNDDIVAVYPFFLCY